MSGELVMGEICFVACVACAEVPGGACLDLISLSEQQLSKRLMMHRTFMHSMRPLQPLQQDRSGNDDAQQPNSSTGISRNTGNKADSCSRQNAIKTESKR